MSGASAPRARTIRRVLIAAALLAGAFLLASVRPTAVDDFFRGMGATSEGTSGTSRRAPDAQDTTSLAAVIAIDPETNATRIIDVTPPPIPPAPSSDDTARTPPATDRELPPPPRDLDVGDLLDQAATPRTGGSTPTVAAVPPRPVEITWPETRRLKQCIGRSVDVKILVGEDGRAQKVEAQNAVLEPECLAAALDAARRVKFEPGRVGGLPVAMWTQVRIDFERKH